MANYFLDTSALAKHYFFEPGTADVENLLQEPNSVHYVSRLTTVEIYSVFALKVRTHEIALHDLANIHKLIATDFNTRRFPVLRMFQSHFEEAGRLIKDHAPTKSLRTLDSLQLAVALDLRNQGKLDYFVCADLKLCNVSKDEGLSVMTP